MTPTPYDAWVLTRLFGDLPVLPEVQAAVSPRLKKFVHEVSRTVPLERVRVLQGYLSADPTGAGPLLDALAAVDPEGPAPEVGVGQAVAGVKVTRADRIVERPIDWLWKGRVPRGMLTVFAGDPKLGKSFVSLGLATAISRGVAMPFGDVPEGPGSVVLLSAEDDPSRVILPRLKHAGADLSRIHIFESVDRGDGLESLPTLRFDLEKIEATAESLGDCRLIVIDPVSAYLGGADDYKNAELRGLLSPLKTMAERLELGVVLVTHLSKSGGSNAKHRVIGSVAYVGACRANFLFAKDATDSTGRRVWMLDIGGNLAPTAPTLAYTIEDTPEGTRLVWSEKPVSITAEDALRGPDDAREGNRARERTGAEEWLREKLANGPLPAKEIESAAREAGFKPTTLTRAKYRLRIESVREGFGKESAYTWKLPDGDAA